MWDSENENDEHGSKSNAASAFMDLYKNSGKSLAFSQEERRRTFLQQQKEKRGATFDEKRDLSELFPSFEVMEVDSVNQGKRGPLPFKYKLMASELIKEVPEDLSEKWLVKLCPEGIRYLVVANKAVTTCYLRNGRSCLKFKSNLPGGNKGTGHKFTVLDCTYNKKSNTFFVFDVLAWNSMALIDSEAEMRFYWLKSQFEENSKLTQIKHSSFRFTLVDCLPAVLPLLQDHLFTPFATNGCMLPYEGVLFYHKEGHYVFGSSPLVGWLKSFMVNEVLHIDVDSYHTQNKPENYETLDQYLNGKCKKKRHKIENVEMEEVDDSQSGTKMCM